MTTNIEIRANEAIKKTNALRTARHASHVTIFANVLIKGERIGHIASDGYSQKTWSFYPVDKVRMQRRAKPLDDVLPKWASKAQIGEFENSIEMLDKHEAKEKKRERHEILNHQVYKAIDSESFPCNPIPFANALADHVRVFGTDSIKTDDAKRILWILMGQAYGQLGTIDLSDEWDRLTKRGGTSA